MFMHARTYPASSILRNIRYDLGPERINKHTMRSYENCGISSMNIIAYRIAIFRDIDPAFAESTWRLFRVLFWVMPNNDTKYSGHLDMPKYKP